MKRSCAGLCALALLALCGCGGNSRGREPEDTVLAQVAGVDRLEEGYLLTAAGQDSSGKSVIQTAEGATLAEAFAAMPGAGELLVSLTNVTQLLLGDGVEPGETLTFILNESGMSWRAAVWSVPIAAAVISGQEDGGASRLTVLEQSGTETVNVLDVLAKLESGEEAGLPALGTADGNLDVVGTVWYGRKT